MTDYRQLLIKYIAIVANAEGNDLLYEIEWPDDEWKALQDLREEVDKALK